MTTADIYGAPAGQPPNSPPTKAALASWWERFKKRNGKDNGDKDDAPGIFGVPLEQSINYANVAISLTNADGKSQVYGYVPVVVAKCGVFLKEKATDVEGIFRLSGSAKRIKDLQTIFNSPDKYGKGLDWTGYTVHDAANVLRRYLNLLPEPIIPLDFYTRFRDPLTVNPNVFDVPEAIRVYQQLIKELPPLNRQLLLYILDLLAVFASKSEQNLMTATNLAAIFQPGLISHPSHEMAPQAYKLSQDVLVFLINHQDHFLLGMKGTNDGAGGAELPQTPTTPSSHRNSNMVTRSNSNGSAGADDVRRFGGVRRNVSVNSKKSNSPVPGRSSGMSRSNTLPSRRSPRVPNPVFRPVDGSTSPKSVGTNATVRRAPSSEDRLSESTAERPTSIELPKRGLGVRAPDMGAMPGSRQTSGNSSQQLERPQDLSPVTTPTRDRNFANIFSLSPGESDRQPRKLRKKRTSGSTSHSAESSTTSLAIVPNQPDPSTSSLATVPGSPPPARTLSPSLAPIASSHHHQQGHHPPPGNSTGSLMPAMSPTPSATSSVTSQDSNRSFSDTTNTSQSPEKKKKSRWRWSNSKVDRWDPPTSPTFGNSNGSIAERIRRVSRSPPAGGRKVSSEASDGDESRTSSRPSFGWLPRRKADPKQEEPKRELALPANAHFPPPQTVQTQHAQPQHFHSQHFHSQHVQPPSSLHIQPPTPIAQIKPMGPLREVSRESEMPRQIPEQRQLPEQRQVPERQVSKKNQLPDQLRVGSPKQSIRKDEIRPGQTSESSSDSITPRQSKAVSEASTPVEGARIPRPINSMLYVDDPPPKANIPKSINTNQLVDQKPIGPRPMDPKITEADLVPRRSSDSPNIPPRKSSHANQLVDQKPVGPRPMDPRIIDADFVPRRSSDSADHPPRKSSLAVANGTVLRSPVEPTGPQTSSPTSPTSPTGKPRDQSDLPPSLQVGVAR